MLTLHLGPMQCSPQKPKLWSKSKTNSKRSSKFKNRHTALSDFSRSSLTSFRDSRKSKKARQKCSLKHHCAAMQSFPQSTIFFKPAHYNSPLFINIILASSTRLPPNLFSMAVGSQLSKQILHTSLCWWEDGALSIILYDKRFFGGNQTPTYWTNNWHPQ